MVLTVVHSLALLPLISVFAVAVFNNNARCNQGVNCCLQACMSPGESCVGEFYTCDNCCITKDCCEQWVDCCLQTCVSPPGIAAAPAAATTTSCTVQFAVHIPSCLISCEGTEDWCTRVNCCLQTCLSSGTGDCQVSVEKICGSTTTTSTEMPTGSGTDPSSSASTAASTSTTPTTSTPSSSASNTQSSTWTDIMSTNSSVATWTPSGSALNSESSARTGPVTSSPESSAENSSVEVAVVTCLVVLFLVVVIVSVVFWRRKRQDKGVRKENNPVCFSSATNLQQLQDSLHVYDKLSYDNKRANIGNASTGAANSPDNDNNDDYTYIDGPAINTGVVRLHQDKRATTTGEHALTDLSVSGLQPDLSSTYRLAQAVDNGVPDSQSPDYFILEESGENGCSEATQYFILEETGKKNSAADTDTQQYFILEERQKGGGRESAPQCLSSRCEADYFVLEKDGGQEPECAGVARSDASRGPPEEAEYCRLDPNSFQESKYTVLSHPAQQASNIGDNPYSLASYPE